MLRRLAITLTVAGYAGARGTCPMAVRLVLESQLCIPLHQLRITRHHPEDYFIIFNLPVHHDDVLRLGSITVDGVKFFIRRWHEDDHAAIQQFYHRHELLIHVDLVEDWMPYPPRSPASA